MTYDEGFAAGMRRAAQILNERAANFPVGHEQPTRGASSYNWFRHCADAILAAITAPAPWTPPSVHTWSHYPVPMPVTADGKGPATIGVDAVSVEYEVWEAEPPHHAVASFDNLPDAINEAIRLSFSPLPPAPEDAA